MAFSVDLAAVLHRNPDAPTWDYSGRIFRRREVAALADDIVSILADAGVPADAAIGIVMRNRPLQGAALIGLIASGRPLTTISAFQAPALLARDIAASRFAAVIADGADWSPEVIEAVSATGAVGIRLALEDAPAISRVASSPVALGDDYHRIDGEPALEVLSSGTTGKPKRIRFPFRFLVRTVEAQVASRMGKTFAVDICTWPFGGIGGLSNLVGNMMLERHMVMIDRFNVPEWLEAVKRYQPDVVTGPPAVMQMVVDSKAPAEDLASIRYFYGGSAPLGEDLIDTLKRDYGIVSIWAYGATEFCGTIISWSLALHEQYGEQKKGSIGKPLAGVEVRIVDAETGDILPAGREGYLEAKVASIGPEWIRTTDLAMIDEDGFAFHRGRGDGAILRGGFKILPETIVEALRRHPSVFDASVVGLPDERLGHVPVAAVQLRSGGPPTGDAELIAFLRGELASPYLPTRILIVPELPRTPSLKVDQRAVGALFA